VITCKVMQQNPHGTPFFKMEKRLLKKENKNTTKRNNRKTREKKERTLLYINTNCLKYKRGAKKFLLCLSCINLHLPPAFQIKLIVYSISRFLLEAVCFGFLESENFHSCFSTSIGHMSWFL